MAKRHWRRALGRRRKRALFLVLRALVRRFGFASMRRIGAVLGQLHYLLNVPLRRRCLHDAARLLQRRPDDPARARQLREAYRVNTIAALEVLAMFERPLDDDTLNRRCHVDGIEHLQAARGGGRGAILLATHSGNALMMAVQLARRGIPVSVIYRQALMMSDDLFTAGLQPYGVEGIVANEGLKAYAKMLGALRQNRVVMIMLDQGVKHAQDGLMMRFLGKDMPMPAGPAQLARHSAAPLLPVTTLAAEPDWRFAIGAPVPRVAGNSLEADLAALLRICEDMVLARPQLWSWHQRRWRDFRLAAEGPASASGGEQAGAARP